MHSMKAVIFGATALAGQAAAHGYVRTWTLDGIDFHGYSRWEDRPNTDAIGWSFTTPDEGPELDVSSPNFACRQGGKPAVNSGTIAAGGQASFLWTSDDKERNPDGWSEGHRGPIITYIAPCNGDCSSVDPSSLKWTKISETGVTGPANTQGTWATDEMRANGGVTTVTIPSNIAPGDYVLRNEIIALHRAHLNEPEFYMACANIEVTGSGTYDLSGSGITASELYSTADKQIYGFSVYDNRGDGADWVVPGPPLYTGCEDCSPPFNPTPTEPPEGTVSILPVPSPEMSILPVPGPEMSILPVYGEKDNGALKLAAPIMARSEHLAPAEALKEAKKAFAGPRRRSW